MPKEEIKQSGNPFPKMEEEVLEFWDKAKTFEKSVESPAGAKPIGDYVFYDGPPFGTGEPHYGHILSSVSKDVVPRYWTMKGYRVKRRWGWDCHGLPIENIIEKDLGISGKKDIEEKIGIAKFNEACRSRVLEYADIWDVMVRRIGRWVDFKNSYKTMDSDYMESVWWGFKKLWNKKLIYEGRKVLLYCPRCETPISNFEVAMDNSYKTISETSVYVKFKIMDESLKNNNALKDLAGQDVNILAWTTTPWTLPGNVALAVGEEVDYVLIEVNDISHNGKTKERENFKFDNGIYIIAKDRANNFDDLVIFAQSKEIYDAYINSEITFEDIINKIHIIKGKDLVGLEYEPLFDVPALKNSGKKNIYKVAGADFVTIEDGTGIVHTAVVYGEDDYKLGLKLDLPVIPALDEKGIFNETVPELTGTYFLKANKIVIEKLKQNGLLFKEEKIEHSYPHCHRCDTQLFYNAIPAWFLNIAKFRKRMLELNKKINWFPEHLKYGRFALGIEQAPDWNISRNRYFATPIPVWKCDGCGEIEVIGSREEMNRHLPSFYVLRHGEALSNTEKVLSSRPNDGKNLTETGKKIIEEVSAEIKNKKIDLIIASDIDRAKETAELVSKFIGAPVVYDERLREVDNGDHNGKKIAGEIKEFFDRYYAMEDIRHPNGENWSMVKERVLKFYSDLFLNQLDKNVLVVSHGDVLTSLEAVLSGDDFFETAGKIVKEKYIQKGEMREIKFKFLDLHKQYADKISWPCVKCGQGRMKRITEVLDGWVESGSMSFAENHYMGKSLPNFDPVKGVRFPAQFISEYISQTRAWFYVMHVMSTALFDSNCFENVVTTGVILNEAGVKMSKSKKNFPDPWKVINESGVDALRFYLMSSSVMSADNLLFNERDLRDILRKNIMLLWNVFKFYELFADKNNTQDEIHEPESKNILDRWIMARLNELINIVTENMDGYNLPAATRPITEFIDDLSTWYLRRSRDRFKSDDAKDASQAQKTTRYVLVQLSKIIAPFTPFIAERIWQKVTGHDFKDENKSVHLESWPSQPKIHDAAGLPKGRKEKINKKKIVFNVKADDLNEHEIIKTMAQVRKIVELALARRDEAGIKVRQPLKKITVINFQFALGAEYIELMEDEVNVKAVVIQAGQGDTRVELDIEITPELRLEGIKREIVRLINGLRKDAGLTIEDEIEIYFETDSQEIIKAVKTFKKSILKDTLAGKISQRGNETVLAQKAAKVEEAGVWLGIKKV